ncbi:hypothetical protein [Shewanella sp.]|uniref:hypothetical protein n=1 Tax=Shewanella sp. TaxID=50422 RepID=UPI000EB90273|nr:hypothetical protein [Shewanella sp.]HCD13151.1 hypothetical protein [Shewanella sp.]
MALFTDGEIRNRAKKEMQRSQNIYKSQAKVLDESASAFNKFKTYDIFLSHSAKDSELILGMKGILEDHRKRQDSHIFLMFHTALTTRKR